MKKILIILMFLLICTIANAGSEQVILSEINAYRVKHHLSPLKMNPILSEAALQHSKEMAEKNVAFGHSGFSKRSHQLSRQFHHVHGIAENVAYVYRDENRAVSLWLASAGHRKNIMGNFNLTGIGIVRDEKGRVYLTQIFLRGNKN